MEKSIFKISTTYGTGTGFMIQNFDLLITNFQVIKGHKHVNIENSNRERQVGKVVFVNSGIDIAFIKIDSYSPSKIIIDKSIEILPQDKVSVLGYSFGMQLSINSGIISNPNIKFEHQVLFQTDAAVNQGDMGGPILSSDGKLLGITASKFQEADNIAFGLPYTILLQLISLYNSNQGDFQAQCPTCLNISTIDMEYCPKCGSKYNSHVFADVKVTHLGLFVENAIQILGLNPILARVGRDFWEFHQGSAFIKMFVFKNDYLLASSKLNKLPKSNLIDILTYLLEDNHHPYTLGIVDNHIYLSYRVHLSDIYSSEVDDIKNKLVNLALKADDLDNFFHDKYQCEFSLESKN